MHKTDYSIIRLRDS